MYAACLRVIRAAIGGSAALAVAWLLAVAEGRELGTAIEQLVEVELASIGINPLTGSPVVLLRQVTSGDVVPIFIGIPEARAILLAMHETPVPRPMTHDLMRELLIAVDAKLERVLVDDLVDGTYLGMLELRVAGQQDIVRVDTRPSDALALAVRTGATIHVAPKILIAGEGLEYEGLPDDQVVTVLGITVVEATTRLRETLDLPDLPGLLVNRSRGPAAQAGLNPGSLILEVNGETPKTPMHLLELVRTTESGEPVTIRYWQDGEEHTLELAIQPGEPDRDDPDDPEREMQV